MKLLSIFVVTLLVGPVALAQNSGGGGNSLRMELIQKVVGNGLLKPGPLTQGEIEGKTCETASGFLKNVQEKTLAHKFAIFAIDAYAVLSKRVDTLSQDAARELSKALQGCPSIHSADDRQVVNGIEFMTVTKNNSIFIVDERVLVRSEREQRALALHSFLLLTERGRVLDENYLVTATLYNK